MYVDKLDDVEAYHVENFGCRASRSDGESIAAQLRLRGLTPAATIDSAQIIVLNTCSVTAEADRSARAFIRSARRRNLHAKIVVTGCYAQRAPEEIARLAGVDAVVGNSHKSLVPEICTDSGYPPPREKDEMAQYGALQCIVPVSALTGQTVRIVVDEAFAHAELASLPFAPDAHQTRPNLKVQDGCGNRCSFCIIPTTRGPSRSVPLATCLESVRRFAANGGQELVLSGINLGRWGRDLAPAQRFVELVTAILTRTALPRLRLSSIEPMDWTPDLLALFLEYATGHHPRLAPHTHLPLQSGSDAILRRMHRRYRPWHYAGRTAEIREALPDAAVGADVMIGFPGETDALFEESYQFIAAQPFTYMHLFPFSPRPGTPGWDLHRDNPVPPAAVQERMAALRALSDEKARAFCERFAGRTLSVITLEGGDASHTPALSANFLKVDLAEQIPANHMVNAHIYLEAGKSTLIGRIIPESDSTPLHRMKQKHAILSSTMAPEPCILEDTHR